MTTTSDAKSTPPAAAAAATASKRPIALPGAHVGPGTATAPPLRQRRNPRLAALGAVIITIGGLLGGWLFTQGGQTEPVVALKDAVVAGERISAEQVGTTQIPAGTGLNTIPGADIDSLIGKYANASLPAGALLSPESVQDELFPPSGKSVVGVALKASQMPARGLLPGDTVRLVVTSAAGAAASTGEEQPPGTTWAATVMTVGTPSDDGTMTTDFVLDTSASSSLAAAAGAGNVAVILDPKKR